MSGEVKAAMLGVSLASGKGGVAKTTSTAALGSALAQHLRVLLVDLDPQSHLTSHFNVSPEGLTSGEALEDGRGHVHASELVPLGYNLDLLPARRESLERAEWMLDRQGEAGQSRLAVALEDLGRTYDVFLVDTPPRLTALTTNALVASDGAIVCLPPRTFDYEGAQALVARVEQVRNSGLNPSLKLLGVLLTMVDADAEETQLVKVAVEQNSWPLIAAEIPYSRLASKAANRGMPVVQAFPNYPISQAYNRAAVDIIDKLGGI